MADSEGATKGVNVNLSRPRPRTTPDVVAPAPTTPTSTFTLTPAPVRTRGAPQTPPPHLNGGDGVGGADQTTPPSPFTDVTTSSSALGLSAYAVSVSTAAGTPQTDSTSLPSDLSKLSLGPAAAGLAAENVKKPPPPPLTEPAAVSWPYSHGVALDDIPGVAYVLDTFLKSQMVESEEYCHRNDPKKCV